MFTVYFLMKKLGGLKVLEQLDAVIVILNCTYLCVCERERGIMLMVFPL